MSNTLIIICVFEANPMGFLRQVIIVEYLAENIRFLIWATKQRRHNPSQTYSEYLDELASKCQIDAERFRGILTGDVTASGAEIASIKRAFSTYDEEHAPYLDCEYLYREAIEEKKDLLIRENIQYLLNSIPWGDNQDFVEALEIQASTLTRWKNGKMKPSKFYQAKICKYFGVPDAESLKTAFLFLGLAPTTATEKKLHLKRLLDSIDREKLEAMYPALVKLLQ